MTRNRVRPRENLALKRRIRRRRSTVAAGAVILAVAFAGICLIIFLLTKSTTKYISNFIGPSETTDYFSKYLEPAVMFNPKTFDNISQAKPEWELETAIWAALDDGEKSGKYAVAEDGREILPVKDVNAYLKKYFGASVKPAFKTFTDQSFTYQYDKKAQCYYIPLIAVTDFYTPSVTKITRNFNTVTLAVDYIPGKNWGQNSRGDTTKPTPDKTMYFVLSGSSGGYTIKAIKDDDSSLVQSSQIGSSASSLSEN